LHRTTRNITAPCQHTTIRTITAQGDHKISVPCQHTTGLPSPL
jgi:hypothetical protein